MGSEMCIRDRPYVDNKFIRESKSSFLYKAVQLLGCRELRLCGGLALQQGPVGTGCLIPKKSIRVANVFWVTLNVYLVLFKFLLIED